MNGSAHHKSDAVAATGAEPCAQAGAIAYRRTGAGTIEVLLIRRRRKRRWGIPKGFIDPGRTAGQTALQEAHEEAGVWGEPSAEPIGRFDYAKIGLTCRVEVYLLNVTREFSHYEEEAFRERRWFSLQDARQRKLRKGVRPLLERLAEVLEERRTPS